MDTVHLEIGRTPGTDCFSGQITGAEEDYHSLKSVPLQSDTEFKAANATMAELIEILRSGNGEEIKKRFATRVQVELGRWLYDSTLGQESKYWEGKRSVDLRIKTDDEYVMSLPWNLLHNRQVFLARFGWRISLFPTGVKERRLESLSEDPRLLLVLPQPEFRLEEGQTIGLRPTGAEEHAKEIKHAVCGAAGGQLIQIVKTWQEFRQALRDFRPQVIYFYGHGNWEREESVVLFEKERGGKRVADAWSMVGIHGLFGDDNGLTAPKLVYLNCCHANTGGQLGAGAKLGDQVPAVVANHTVAWVDSARRQACDFLHRFLVKRAAPHDALGSTIANSGGLDIKPEHPAWFNPTLFRSYAKWEAPVGRPESHPDAELDRHPQFGELVFSVRDMLKNGEPDGVGFLWHGIKGQGTREFHRRVRHRLKEEIDAGIQFVTKNVRCPDLTVPREELRKRLFVDMLTDAFDVRKLEDVVNKLPSSATCLINLDHGTLGPEQMSLPLLKKYLDWFAKDFLKHLRDEIGGVHFLLGISYEHAPSEARQFKTELSDLNLTIRRRSGLVFRTLEELGKLTKEHLHDYLLARKVKLPTLPLEDEDEDEDYIDEVLNGILQKIEKDYPQGNWQLTLYELENIVDNGFPPRPERD